MSKHKKSPQVVESTQSFQPFTKIPTIAEFAKTVDAVNSKRTPPPIGSSPDQVRQHYQGNAHINPTQVQSPIPLPSCATDLIDTRTAQDYQNQEAPVFHSSEGGVSVELPSKFVFYDFKELYIHPFKGKHLAKLARAAKEKSARLTAEVMSSVLEVPGKQIGGLAFQLTMPDYYWLLYFQRKNCYTKVSFNHTTRCKNHKHIQQVLDGTKDPDSLVIKAVIDTTRLETVDYVPFEVSPQLQELGAHCPTIGDFVLSIEDKRFGNSDYNYTANLACLIHPELPWEQRLGIIDDLSPDLIGALKEYETRVMAFGVHEKAVVTCKGCGASNETVLSIDASSFLPSA